MLIKYPTFANVWRSIPASWLVLMSLCLSCAMQSHADAILPLDGVYKGSSIMESNGRKLSAEDLARLNVLKGLALAEPAKALVESAFNAGGNVALYEAAQNWNATFVPTPPVVNIQISNYGVITIQYDDTAVPVYSFTVLTPNAVDGFNYEALNFEFPVDIEWACAGMSYLYATGRGMVVVAGTTSPEYSPEYCR